MDCKFMKHISSLTESSIEEWCKELEKCQCRQMTKDESDILLRATIAEKEIEKDDLYDKMVASNDNMVSMIHKRIKHCHTYTAGKSVVIVLAYICNSPGIAVQYCNFIQYKCHQKKISHVDMTAFSRLLFPWGFFKDDDLQRMWELQKVMADDGRMNMLDRNECMKSIQELK